MPNRLLYLFSPVSLVFSLLLLVTPPHAFGAAGSKGHLVLVFNSFYESPGYSKLNYNLQSTINAGAREPVEFSTEYLGWEQSASAEHEQELLDFYARKYAARKPDLLIAVSRPALQFLVKYRDRLYPGTPILYCSIEERVARAFARAPDITGVTMTLPLKPLLDLMLRLRPDTQRVLIVNGTTHFETFWGEQIQEEARAYKPKLGFESLAGLSLQQVLGRMATAPPHSVVLFLSLRRDGTGEYLYSNEALRLVHEASAAPIFSVVDDYLGDGVVGGAMLNFEAQGKNAGELALRILAGEKASSIPVVHVTTNPYVFDGRELRRWGIPDERLPAGSIIRYRYPLFWQQYRWAILGAAGLCAVEALLILGLLMNRARRHRIAVALAERLRFETLASELSARFIALPAGEIDSEIESSLSRIGQCLGIDCVRLLEFGEDKNHLQFRRSALDWDIEATPSFVRMQQFPWSTRKLLAAETIRITKLDEFPQEARNEKEAVLQMGIKSILTVPLGVGGSVLGAISFAALKTERAWPDEMVSRLRWLGEIYSNALKRKRMVEELHDSEILKTAILASLGSNIVVLDDRGTILAVNDAWLRFGQERGASTAAIGVGANYLHVCRQASRSGSKEAEQALRGIEAVCSGALQSFEQEYECHSATEQAWYQMSVTRLRRPEGGVVIAHKDITEQKRSYAVLRESEERFRVMADTTPVLIWMSGKDKGCTYFNRNWIDFTGRPLAEQLGDGWVLSVHPDDLERCMTTYNRAFDARENFRIEYRLRRFDGVYRWILDCGVPRFNADGSFVGFIGSGTDISNSKEAEETLGQLGGRLLEAQEQERKRIARELHDDINQRLALLAIELEQTATQPPPSTLETADRIHQLWKHTVEISRNVQALSHQLHSSQLEYLGLVAAARSLCSECSAQHHIEVEFTHAGVPSGIPPEISLAVFRVLQEALQNVVKHSRAQHANVELTCVNHELLLRVRDTGEGFDPEFAKHRGGLGLISMQERLHLIGGSFWIHSRPMQGTEVNARVALRKLDQAQRRAKTAA